MDNQSTLIAAISATTTAFLMKAIDWIIYRNTNWRGEINDLRAQLEEYRDRVAQCDRQAAHFLMRIAQLEFMLGIKKKSDE